jgi:hypothetical protein
LTATRFSQRSIGLGFLAAAMIVSAVALMWIGRGQTIRGDELEYATRLATQPFGHTLLHTPPNKYLIAVPLIVYRAMFELFGLSSYVPYHLLATVLVLICAGLFYALVRRHIGYLLAIPPTVLLLFFGSGWEEVLTAIRLPSLIAVATGLGALLALDKRELAWDLVAAVLLCVAVASHPTGVAFTAAAAVLVLLSPAPQRWKRAWVFLAPAAVFAAWYLIWRTTTPTVYPNTASAVFLFVRQSWVMLCATVTGLSGVLDQPVYRQPIAEIIGALLFVLLVVAIALRFRRLPAGFWAALAGLVVLIVSTRLSAGGFLRMPDEGRYLFPETVLFLLMFAALAGPLKLPRWGEWAVAVVILFGISSNVAMLVDGGDMSRAKSEIAKGQLSAFQIAGANVIPEYRPSPLETTAGLDLAAMARFGSPAVSGPALANASLLTRQSADRALVGSLGIKLVPAAGQVARSGTAPHVLQTFEGRVARRRGCVVLSAPPAGGATQTETLGARLAELALPPQGVEISSEDMSRVHALLGKFAPPSVPLAAASGRRAVLRTPADESSTPWKLTVASNQRVAVCGIPGG